MHGAHRGNRRERQPERPRQRQGDEDKEEEGRQARREEDLGEGSTPEGLRRCRLESRLIGGQSVAYGMSAIERARLIAVWSLR
jgi:hypothetical protein